MFTRPLTRALVAAGLLAASLALLAVTQAASKPLPAGKYDTAPPIDFEVGPMKWIKGDEYVYEIDVLSAKGVSCGLLIHADYGKWLAFRRQTIRTDHVTFYWDVIGPNIHTAIVAICSGGRYTKTATLIGGISVG